MPRKVSHKKNIISEQTVTVGKLNPKDIIHFKYKGDDIYDITPLVFILPTKDIDKKKNIRTKQVVYGININYLTEFVIEQLLGEKDLLRMKKYSLYKEAYRAYSVDKMSMIKIVEYKTNKMLAEERKQQREANE